MTEELSLDAVSVTYHYGAKTKLNGFWHDKNVIVPNSKIYYVTSGKIKVTVGSREYVAAVGDAILIPAGTKHDYSLYDEVTEAEKYWFHFDMRKTSAGFFEGLSLPYLTHVGTDSEILELYEKAVSFGRKTDLKSRLECSSAVLRIVAVYFEKSGYRELADKENDEIDKVIKHVKKNYSEKFTLDELAKMARLAPNYFAKKFKERTGHPPLKYVNVLKIERAKFLLEHTEKPICAIMEEIGLLDAAHFSKLFRASTGYSPKKFRDSFKNR